MRNKFLILIAFFCSPLQAQDISPQHDLPERVDVALMLAVDVSSSIDFNERRFQREAYAVALSDPLVVRSILGGSNGSVGLGYMEWSGSEMQHVILPMQVIKNEGELSDFVRRIEDLATTDNIPEHRVRMYYGNTAVGNALIRASAELDRFKTPADNYVIDISGDGLGNEGTPVAAVRSGLVEEGITINALPIWVSDRPGWSEAYSETQKLRLETYFANCVVGGKGSFYITANGWTDFETALRAKLVLELAGLDPDARQRAAEIVRAELSATGSYIPASFTINLNGKSLAPDEVACPEDH